MPPTQKGLGLLMQINRPPVIKKEALVLLMWDYNQLTPRGRFSRAPAILGFDMKLMLTRNRLKIIYCLKKLKNISIQLYSILQN